jgi:phage gp29-like protein
MQQLQEDKHGQGGEQLHKLPSGEDTLQALLELQDDIAEYDTHVYSRMSQRDLQGL